MAGENSIQILRGATTYDPSTSEEILLDGQPFYSKKDRTLYIGDGSTQLQHLIPVANDSNYAKLDSANTFTGTDSFTGNDAKLVLNASASIPLHYKGGYNNSGIKLENNMGPCDSSGNNFNSITYGFNNILVSSYNNLGQVNVVGLYFPEEGGTLATQGWVTTNAGGGSSSSDAVDLSTNGQEITGVKYFTGNTFFYNKTGATAIGSNIYIQPTSGNGDARLSYDGLTILGSDDIHQTTYKDREINQNYMSNSYTLTLPQETGTLATQEWVDAQKSQVQIITWEDND